MRVLVDGRCSCAKCEERTTDVYRMIGYCENCRADVMVIFRVGDKAAPQKCSRCGNFYAVKITRAATDEELPVDYEMASR